MPARSVTIPATHKVLFERPIVASLATVMKDGQPQVQPVWVSYDGRHVLVNTEKGRIKYRNMHERRKVTLLLIDPDDVYHWIEIRGVVESETEQGAAEHLDQLAKRYINADKYPWHKPGDVRVLFRITPTRVVPYGPQ
jgi:PPOX class probable F420-dependent enzyme